MQNVSAAKSRLAHLSFDTCAKARSCVHLVACFTTLTPHATNAYLYFYLMQRAACSPRPCARARRCLCAVPWRRPVPPSSPPSRGSSVGCRRTVPWGPSHSQERLVTRVLLIMCLDTFPPSIRDSLCQFSNNRAIYPSNACFIID